MSSLGPLIVIILVIIIGIVWYFIHLIAQGFSQLYKDESAFLSDQLKALLGVDDVQRNSYRPSVEPLYISNIVDLIVTSIRGLWLGQLLYILLLLFLFFIVVGVFFIEQPFQFLFNMIVGVVTVSLFSHYIIQTNGKGLTRALISASFSKEDCYSYMYSCGFAMLSLLISLFLGMYVLMYYFNLAIWGGELKQKEYEKISILMIGYLMGLLVGGFIYREGLSLMSRSFKTATIGLIKSDVNLSVGNSNISQLTRLTYMVSQQTGNTLINYLDIGFILVFLCCSVLTLFVNSAEVLESENKNTFILGPIYLICLGYLGSIFCYLMRTMCRDSQAPSFTAINVRWQVIIGALISFIILVTFPFNFLISQFTLKGSNSQDIDLSGKSSTHACWCYLLGLIFNVIHISLFEWYTSHGCSKVRNLGLATSDRIMPMNLIYSNYLGDLFSAIPMVLMLLLITIVYSIQGFAGLLFAASGYTSVFIIYGIIYQIGCNSSESYKLTCFVHFKSEIQGRIFAIYWEAKNYMIYLKSTNAGALTLISIGFIGSQLYQHPGTLASLFTHYKGIIGLLIGFAIMFVCRGLSIWAIINMAKTYFICQPSNDSEGKINYFSDNRIIEFTKVKYTQSILHVSYNVLFLTFTLLLTGYLYGQQGTIAAMIGSSISILLIQYNGLIKGTALENAKIYNEIEDNKKTSHYVMYVAGDTYACATEESNACPLVAYFIFSFCLLISCQNKFTSADQ
ncbi:unnamed protein product [Paramecium octaurelia]|uniref:H(+)-exporting diphosphatase n=1 Tax=Paramecium octaurelia TaxID=43137 RepID=A0A8S1XF39_PAROT|nr:unnamed protein product [Paramecium octaurelia]